MVPGATRAASALMSLVPAYPAPSSLEPAAFDAWEQRWRRALEGPERDFAAPGNLDADLRRLNRLRRQQPALQRHDNLRFQLHGVAWFFLLGWLLHRSTTVPLKLVTLTEITLAAPGVGSAASSSSRSPCATSSP